MSYDPLFNYRSLNNTGNVLKTKLTCPSLHASCQIKTNCEFVTNCFHTIWNTKQSLLKPQEKSLLEQKDLGIYTQSRPPPRHDARKVSFQGSLIQKTKSKRTHGHTKSIENIISCLTIVSFCRIYPYLVDTTFRLNRTASFVSQRITQTDQFPKLIGLDGGSSVKAISLLNRRSR